MPPRGLITQNAFDRSAFTLVELLVILAITAVLMALTISGVARVRLQSDHVRTLNQIRQLAIAHQQYIANEHGYRLGIEDVKKINSPGVCPLFGTFRYIDGEVTWQEEIDQQYHVRSDWRTSVACLADRSLSMIDDEMSKRSFRYAPTSFAYNMTAFAGCPGASASEFSDGMSTTIAYATKHSFLPNYLQSGAQWQQRYYITQPPLLSSEKEGIRRCSIADAGWNDPVATTSIDPATSISSVPGTTFGSYQRLETVNIHLPHAFGPSGLVVSMFDGSVRTLSPLITENIYWAMTTRNRGDAVSE